MSYIFINHKGCGKEATNTTLVSQRSRVVLAECGYCALARRLKGGELLGKWVFLAAVRRWLKEFVFTGTHKEL